MVFLQEPEKLSTGVDADSSLDPPIFLHRIQQP